MERDTHEVSKSALIGELQRISAKQKKRSKACREITYPLSNDTFSELAALTSEYSEHARTRTVIWCGGVLQVRRSDACTDSRLDTFRDNGPVARAYVKLLDALLRHAAESKKSGSEDLLTLGLLYRLLTSQTHEACNQENAAEFGELLLLCNPTTSRT